MMRILLALVAYVGVCFGFARDFDVIVRGPHDMLLADDFLRLKKCDSCHIFDIVSFRACMADKRGYVLIFGGIQGDEPGGFHAAASLVDGYEFYDKVLIVPNLAYESILLRGRGVHGDLNRKFSSLSQNDPDYARIQQIKSLILQDDIDFIINLHDGSGFYSTSRIDAAHNPDKWGNACIIDQEKIHAKHGELYDLASHASSNINAHLLKPNHRYHIKNTHTKDGDEQMLKALTYFAITHGKAAVANEASKDLPTHERVYYHLLAIEGYLDALGVRYKRNFALTPLGVYHHINKNYTINIADMIVLPINDLRAQIGYVPFDGALLDDGFVRIDCASPLVALYRQPQMPPSTLRLQYGNRLKSIFKTFNIKYANNFARFKMLIDGALVDIPKSGIYKVKNSFKIIPQKGVRFNIIGYQAPSGADESDILIDKSMISKRFSLDKNAKMYRIELYERADDGERFAGMVIVEFEK